MQNIKAVVVGDGAVGAIFEPSSVPPHDPRHARTLTFAYDRDKCPKETPDFDCIHHGSRADLFYLNQVRKSQKYVQICML